MPAQWLALVRHGETEANVALATTACGLYYSRCGSDPTIPLTPAGHAQGVRAGKRLSGFFPRGRKLEVIFNTSEFERVVATTRLVRRALPYRVKTVNDPRLKKRCYGDFWNLTREGVQALHPDEWLRYSEEGDLHYRAPGGGENYFDLFARIDEFIDEVLAATTGNVAIIGSSAPLLAFQRRFDGLTPEEVLLMYEKGSFRNGELVLYSREHDGSWQRCESCNN